MTDAVWLVGGPSHDDRSNLRHSIRSIARNMPCVDKMWVIGDSPAWLSDTVRAIRLTPAPGKFANQCQSLAAAVNHAEITDKILVLSDDQFAMRPVLSFDALPVTHLGLTNDYAAKLSRDGFNPRNTWLQAVVDTAEWIGARGFTPLCYETHTPLLFDTAALAWALREYPAGKPLAYPQLYPMCGAGDVGEIGLNAKIVTDAEYDERAHLPFLSCADSSWSIGRVGKLIRDTFPDPSVYEV